MARNALGGGNSASKRRKGGLKKSRLSRYCVFFHQSSPCIELPQVLSSTPLEDLATDKERVRHDVLALFPWLEIYDLASVDGNKDHAKAVCIRKEGVLALATQYFRSSEWTGARMNLLHHPWEWI